MTLQSQSFPSILCFGYLPTTEENLLILLNPKLNDPSVDEMHSPNLSSLLNYLRSFKRQMMEPGMQLPRKYLPGITVNIDLFPRLIHGFVVNTWTFLFRNTTTLPI